MTAATHNGRSHTNHNYQPQPRKQLCDQIDRLDVLVDGLADELPKAVADATREGTRQAVKDVLVEFLTNPEIVKQFRSLITPQVMPTGSVTPPVPTPVATPVHTPEPQRSVFARWKARVKSGVRSVIAKMKQIVALVKTRIREAKERLHSAVSTVRNIVPIGRFLLIAIGVGTTLAGVCYVAPPEVSAVVSGIGGASVALTLQLARWVRRSAKSLIWLK